MVHLVFILYRYTPPTFSLHLSLQQPPGSQGGYFAKCAIFSQVRSLSYYFLFLSLNSSCYIRLSKISFRQFSKDGKNVVVLLEIFACSSIKNITPTQTQQISLSDFVTRSL